MHADTYGPEDGGDVVCLHGGIGTGRAHWAKQARTLADEGWHVHTPDLPGHGSTLLDDGADYGRDLLVDALAGYLLDLGGPVHLMGFSMGGHTILRLLDVGAPDELDLRSLAVVGVSVEPHDGLDAWRGRFDADTFADRNPMWARYLSKIHEPLGGEDAWMDVMRRDSGGMDLTVDLDRLARWEVPTLLVRGDADEAIDPGHYTRLRRTWPHAHEHVVPDGGHDVHLTRHEHVALSLTEHLAATRE